MIACENCARQVRSLRFRLTQNLKKIRKKSIFAALGAPEDFENFDKFLHHFKSIAAEQLFVTIVFQKKTKIFFHSTLLSSTSTLVYTVYQE